MPLADLTPANKVGAGLSKRGSEKVLREIEAANRISIIKLLRVLHNIDADEQLPMKLYCMWGNTHADGGLERALRTYPETNSAFCFAGCGWQDPVGLARRTWGLRAYRAAQRLNDEYGDPTKTWQERVEANARSTTPADIKAILPAVLHYHLQADPDYGTLSLDPRVLAATEAALVQLDGANPTPDEARAWLGTAVKAVSEALDKASL